MRRTAHERRDPDAIWFVQLRRILAFTQKERRRGRLTKGDAIQMHTLSIDKMAKLPRKSLMLLYERTGAPFKPTGAIQELRAPMAKPAVQDGIGDRVARKTVAG